MRWEGQSTAQEADGRLPGLSQVGTVRTFDAPEAMGVRFHEVEAKSALNRVPGESLPFNFTVNPYRGCTHACSYCVHGDTPVLMGDGRHRPIGELVACDEIYGTRREGRYRRYIKTEIRDRWETNKPAYRVVLEDSTEIVASGDHRFLSNRGWKFVTGTEHGGPNQRPHLTANNCLLGVGRFANLVEHSEDYRRGYLTGMIRGDGHVGTYRYDRPGRTNGDVHRFRLALADEEGLDRTQGFLELAGVPTKRFEFTAATEVHRAVAAIRTSSGPLVERIRSLVAWPTHPQPDWIRGFLAGIFDAEGGCNQGVLRIGNTDPELLDRTSEGLTSLGLPWILEDGAGVRCPTIRVTGGLPSHLRFFHTTDPAILRKRSIEGRAVKCRAPLGIVSVEYLGRQDLVDISTGTGDFVADGVISHNCFARPTHRYLDLNAREDFEREIVVKVNIPERLRVELKRPSWKGETIALGTNTDPYQWVEGRYGLTRAIWEVLIEARNPGSVLTKSSLLLRDVDLFRELNEVAGFQASLSIPTLDEAAWRATEPRTPHPRKRIEAVAELSAAGVPVGVLIAPLMPGINDSPEQVEEILRLCSEAGARSVGGLGLHLKGEVREIFLDWLRGYRPDLLPRYEELYAGGAFLPKPERRRITGMLNAGRRRNDVRAGSMEERRLATKRDGRSEPVAADRAEPDRQASLF